jgi:hypothetical protein
VADKLCRQSGYRLENSPWRAKILAACKFLAVPQNSPAAVAAIAEGVSDSRRIVCRSVISLRCRRSLQSYKRLYPMVSCRPTSHHFSSPVRRRPYEVRKVSWYCSMRVRVVASIGARRHIDEAFRAAGKGPARADRGQETVAIYGRYDVWSKISNALKKLGFRSRNFLA